jgi:integrase
MATLTLIPPGTAERQPMLALSLPSERIVEAGNLDAIIDAYITETGQSITPDALKNYENHLRPFRRWWIECADQHQQQLSRNTLRAYVLWLETDYHNAYGVAPSDYAINKSLALVRRVLRWAFHAGCVTQDISELVPHYEASEKEKYFPEIAELNTILHSIDTPTAVRDTAIWCFLLATGMRRMEIAEAQASELTFNTPLECLRVGDDHGGYIRLRKVKGDSEGKGKGRYSVFDSTTGLLLKAWLRGSRHKDGSIFGLGDDGIRMVINDTAKHAGIDRMHPHACRDAFISWWVAANVERGPWADAALRLQVGHKPLKGDSQTPYLSKNRNWILRQIRAFYTTPLDAIQLDWRRYPVHIPRVAS